jgi:hypothetical protein
MSEELLTGAPLSQLLVLAAHRLVRAGADRSTAQIRRVQDDLLVLISHIGFDHVFADHFSVISPRSTPCGRAMAERRVTEVPDVELDPHQAADDKAVLLAAGIRSCTSFPIADTDGEVVAVISAYHAEPGPHDHTASLAIAEEIGRHVPGSREIWDDHWHSISRNLQLQEALETRTLIATAKGILMARSDTGQLAAFQMLVQASQRENVRLREICERIVQSHEDQVVARSVQPG